MTHLEYFRLFATEFASMSDVDVGVWLTIAGNQVSVSGLSEENQKMALALYAAHLIKTQQEASSGGVIVGSVIREKEGDLEREYAQTTNKSFNSAYATTAYGRQFAQMIKGGLGGAITCGAME